MSPELPPGWASPSLSELCEFNPRHHAAEDRQQLVSFVPMPAVSDKEGLIEQHEARPLEEVWKGYTHFAEGDVIFAKITPCMENGKIAVARNLHNGLACGSTEFHVLRPADAVAADYIWYFLRQREFRVAAERQMTGAVGQRRVPKSYLERHLLPLPPTAEQRRIVAKLDSLFARTRRAREELERIAQLGGANARELGLLGNLEKALLAKAFRGELVPQDPNDEPAAALLARIRAARAAEPKPKRQRHKAAAG